MEQNAQPAEGQARPEIRTRPRRNSRRKVLTNGLGVAAATVGAGTLLELSSGKASASSIKPGVFASSVAGTPAVKATGTNKADGVDASSDSGVGGSGQSSSGSGVFGSSSSNDGVFGSSSSGLAGLFESNVQVNNNLSATGNLLVTGSKTFVQDHPNDPSREIVYVALGGGEAGTYVRGTGTLVNGKAVLALPEHFGLVTNNEGLTIQLTPRGGGRLSAPVLP